MSNLLITILIQILLPINTGNREDILSVAITPIGQFGELRKPRREVPAHLHTGVDMKRPSGNYNNEPIFPIAEGRVISKRTDGPYAQLIIEHRTRGLVFWSLYEHIAGIRVKVNDMVSPLKPIARFMNREELDRYGWQFDHLHFEVLKIKPLPLAPNAKHPDRFYGSYSLVCYLPNELNACYFNPLLFIEEYNMKN
jgi:murein DD-endopeptidase MepM/ murein hydrolase activator NlpD